MLDTSPEQIEILQQVKAIYQGYKKSLNFSLTRDQDAAIRDMHKQFYGVAVPNCGKCLLKASYTLLVESGVGV